MEKPDVYTGVENPKFDRMDFFGVFLKYVAEEGRWVEDKTKQRILLGWLTTYRDKGALKYFIEERIIPMTRRPERAVWW